MKASFTQLPCKVLFGQFSQFVSSRLTLVLARVISSTLKMRRHFPPKRRFIINSHGAKSQKTAFLIVIAMITSCPIIQHIGYFFR
jgi:hypothetical protein